MSIVEGSPEQLPLARLELACAQETRRFRANEPSDPRFCLEIFRRALRHTAAAADGAPPEYADEEARVTLVRVYDAFIKAHIGSKALLLASRDDLVQQAWMRFWRAANAGLAFPTLEAALTYLRRTVVSAVIAQRREADKQRREDSLTVLLAAPGGEETMNSGQDIAGEHERRRFYERCGELLTDPLEREVFWLRYGRAAPPREIAERLSRAGQTIAGRKPSARGVSDTLDRCFRRLEADEELRDFLSGD